MGTIIKETALSTRKTNHSSNAHTVDAAIQCIEAAGISKTDIDIIINIGIYRDKNILEPAMAAFLQKGAGIKGDYARKQGFNAVFSFDLMNSACGIINAIQSADAILRTKRDLKYALITSADCHPSNKKNSDFPFSCVGVAMLLEYVEDETRGFSNYAFNASANTDYSVKGYLDFNINDGTATDRLTIEYPDTYNEKIFEFTSKSVNEYLSSTKLDRSSLKLIAPQIYEGFGKKLADITGIKDHTISDLYKGYGNAHTSALGMAYHLGLKSGRYNENDKILFVAAGSGLSSACATYTV